MEGVKAAITRSRGSLSQMRALVCPMWGTHERWQKAIMVLGDVQDTPSAGCCLAAG